MRKIRTIPIFISAVILSACGSATCSSDASGIDQRSYNLGILGGFAEVVKLGVKELALSEVMTPQAMDDIMEDARRVAERNEVLLYRESDFLVTDLYPADVATGKHVLLIYTGDTLDKYLAIKNDKKRLTESGQYEGAAREAIARRFGRLLSYPEPVITRLISRQAGDG